MFPILFQFHELFKFANKIREIEGGYSQILIILFQFHDFFKITNKSREIKRGFYQMLPIFF